MSSRRPLLPRSAPAASGISSRSIALMLDRLEARSVECHSIMVVHRGHVVAEGWWAPYSADRPHLLYSLTKSFTSIAVGLAIDDGLLSPDDRVVDVLPDHVPADVSEQGSRITVHHLLSMTAGHPTDSLGEAWELEPEDLVKGFLRLPFGAAEERGTPTTTRPRSSWPGWWNGSRAVAFPSSSTSGSSSRWASITPSGTGWQAVPPSDSMACT